MNRSGKIIIVAAPSGAGKTSLVKAVTAEVDHLRISVSHTTRPPRPADQDGVQYHFVDEIAYEQMVADSAFLEHATVFGCHYGTSKQWVLEQLQQGVDVILEIDWQGARQLRQQFAQAVSIYILPPSVKELTRRLQGRQQDDKAVIAARMAEARSELLHYTEFDYLIVNDDFEKAKDQLKHIILAERLRLQEQRREQAELLAELLKND